MTKVTLYCVQPLLIAGFQAIMKGLDGFEASICTDAADLLDHLAVECPQVILFEVTSSMELGQLRQMMALNRNAAVILWLEDISPEFASQAISLGVRGLLRRSLSIDLQARCLLKVAAGDLWVEKTLSNRLLSTQRVSLTPRERQLVVLVAQGLKNKEIGFQLGITEGTVKVHVKHTLKKLNLKSRVEAALWALGNK